MRSDNGGERNPLARQRAQILGLTPAPQWGNDGEMLLARCKDPTHCEGGLYPEEETTPHPEQVPLLTSRHVDETGAVWGEVWLLPASRATEVDRSTN